MAERIVYGARCTWWDSISNVATKASGLPCCPHCGSPLFEQPDERTWWAGVDAYERDAHPGYRELIEWSRGRCIPQDGRPVIDVLAEAKARHDESANAVRDKALALASMVPDLAPSLHRIANHPALGLGPIDATPERDELIEVRGRRYRVIAAERLPDGLRLTLEDLEAADA